MASRLLKVQLDYLTKRYADLPADVDAWLPARRAGDVFEFHAFGRRCRIQPDGITLDGEPVDGPEGVLIALYFRYANPAPVRLEPVKAFKEIPGTMPYHGAFAVRSERCLIPHVAQLQARREDIVAVLDGCVNEPSPGDFSLTLFPLPKVPLYYIFYLADDEFSASVTCLLAFNAESFMPVDGLADVGEYTAKRIIEILRA